MKIRIILPAGDATGEIVDSAAGRDFLSLLPLSLSMIDLLDRERTGPLPRGLAGAADADLTYSVGQIGYWHPDPHIMFFTEDDGELKIPEPGNVHLGTIASGLELIAAAGEEFSLTIERA